MDDALLKESAPRIAAIYEQCNADQPNFGVSEDCFAASLQKTISKYLAGASSEPVTTEQVNDFLDQIQAADLFMSLACANGNERAWWEFDTQHRGYMERVARHLAKTEADARRLSTPCMLSSMVRVWSMASVSRSFQPTADGVRYGAGCGR
jgi:hypothetical protein